MSRRTAGRLLAPLLLAAATAGLAPTGAPAADRALLIGATDYLDDAFDLPGLDLDLVEMERFARRLGFAAGEIRTLVGERVTADEVRRQFRTFLTDGVGADDTVLVYYTGHGLQVSDAGGDEADGRDEALSMHDLAPAARGWDGILLDDELAALLGALPSDNVIVIVDACHSGTVTRGYAERVRPATRSWGDGELVAKTLPFRADAARGAAGAPKAVPDGGSDATPSGVVALSAAQDDERSWSSVRGSLFTLALGEVLHAADAPATPRALTERATALLESRLDAEYLFRPNLTGDESLFEKSIVLGDGADGGSDDGSEDGPDDGAVAGATDVGRATALALAEGAAALAVRADRDAYAVDEPIALEIDVPAPGWLNVVAVDADDRLVLLYPNRFEPDARVAPGTLALPGAGTYAWVAQPPWGPNLVVALYTPAPANLFESSLQRAPGGEALADFVLPSTAGLEALAASAGRRAGTLSIDTCPTPEECSR